MRVLSRVEFLLAVGLGSLLTVMVIQGVFLAGSRNCPTEAPARVTAVINPSAMQQEVVPGKVASDKLLVLGNDIPCFTTLTLLRDVEGSVIRISDDSLTCFSLLSSSYFRWCRRSL